MKFLIKIYTALFTVSLPFIFIRFWIKGQTQPAYRHRLLERLGCYGKRELKKTSVWLHAVSFGEVEVARPILENLLEQNQTITVTTTTPTGAARVEQLFGQSIQHIYLPVDLPWCIRRFLKAITPKEGYIIETELWPNLIAQSNKHKVTLALLNARLSERSFKRYDRIRGVISSLLAKLDLIICQSEEDKNRFVALCDRPQHIVCGGNMKFDIALQKKANTLTDGPIFLEPNAFIWLAASTHPGEEEIILDIAQQLKTSSIPSLKLIIAPRHPERGEQIAQLVDKEIFNVLRRTSCRFLRELDCDVLVLDTLGELFHLFSMADIVFMGGSLVPHGGHNLLEPIAQKVPVVTGPHMQNFQWVSQQFVQAGAIKQVKSPDELVKVIDQIYHSESLKETLIKQGVSILRKHQGAIGEHNRLIQTYFGL